MQVRRYYQGDKQIMDIIYDEQEGISETPTVVTIDDPHTTSSPWQVIGM